MSKVEVLLAVIVILVIAFLIVDHQLRRFVRLTRIAEGRLQQLGNYVADWREYGGLSFKPSRFRNWLNKLFPDQEFIISPVKSGLILLDLYWNAKGRDQEQYQLQIHSNGDVLIELGRDLVGPLQNVRTKCWHPSLTVEQTPAGLILKNFVFTPRKPIEVGRVDLPDDVLLNLQEYNCE